MVQCGMAGDGYGIVWQGMGMVWYGLLYGTVFLARYGMAGFRYRMRYGIFLVCGTEFFVWYLYGTRLVCGTVFFWYRYVVRYFFVWYGMV